VAPLSRRSRYVFVSRVFTRLGGEGTEPLGGSAGARAGDRCKPSALLAGETRGIGGVASAGAAPIYLKPEAHLKSRGQLTARSAPRQNGVSEAGVLGLRRCG